MPTIQNSPDVSVRVVRESVTGTAPAVGTTPCHTLRLVGNSPGLNLKRAPAKSGEMRADRFAQSSRLGFKTVDGSYNLEGTVGGAVDMLLEAIMRSTWAASALKFTCDAGAAHTSLAFTANTVTLAGTDTFTTTHGIKVGDVFRCGAVGATIDNINCMVASIDGTGKIITTVGSPLAVVGADTNATFTLLKKVIASATPTRYSHTFEQYAQDVDLSKNFVGCRVTGIKLAGKPGAPVTMSVTIQGMDRTLLVTGTSPYFTTPTTTTGLTLMVDDSAIWVNGATAAYVTGFDLDFAINAKGEPVIGSAVSPDIFDGICSVTGTMTGMVTSAGNEILYDAETTFEVGLLLQEPGAVPRGCLGFYFGQVKIMDLSAPVGVDVGPQIETMKVEMQPKVAATGYDAGVGNICSSGA